MRAIIYAAANRFAFLKPGYKEADSLAKINGKTLIELQAAALLHNGIDDLWIVLPKGNKEVPALLEGKNIHFLYLEERLGTSGGLALLPKDEDVLFVPGDVIFDVDLPSFFAFHQEKGALLTCLCHPEAHPEKKDVLVIKPSGQGFIILPKETVSARDFYYHNIIPTELCILSPAILGTFDPEDLYPTDFREEVFEPTLAVEGLYAYPSAEYVKTITGKAALLEIETSVKKGIVEKMNKKNPQTAFFLDRDGTITSFADYVVRPDMLHLVPGAAEAINRIHAEGGLAICITNQPLVARGQCSSETMTDILANLELLLGKEGAYLDGIYYCPHYPKAVPNSNMEYTKECDCRKPKIGLLLKAQEHFHIDLGSSWFIGDTCRDVQTGLNAGCHTALLLKGDPHPYNSCGDAKAELVCGDLPEAVASIFAK